MSTSQMSTRMENQRGSTAAGALALIGGLLGVASVLLPWATISIAEIEGLPGLGESKSFTGWTFNDGKVLVILASLVVLMGVIMIVKRLTGGSKGLAIGAIVLSLAMLGIAGYDTMQVKDNTAGKIGDEITAQVDQAGDIPPEQRAAVDEMVAQIVDAIEVSVGIGLYLALLGGLLGIVGGAMGLKGVGGTAATAAGPPMATPVDESSTPAAAPPSAAVAPEAPPAAPPASEPGTPQP